MHNLYSYIFVKNIGTIVWWEISASYIIFKNKKLCIIIFKNCYVTIVIYKVCRYRIKHTFELITVKTRNLLYTTMRRNPINFLYVTLWCVITSVIDILYVRCVNHMVDTVQYLFSIFLIKESNYFKAPKFTIIL